jgi:hypothetical protein
LPAEKHLEGEKNKNYLADPKIVIIRLDRIIQFFCWIAQSSWAMTETEKLKQLLKSLNINSIFNRREEE